MLFSDKSARGVRQYLKESNPHHTGIYGLISDSCRRQRFYAKPYSWMSIKSKGLSWVNETLNAQHNMRIIFFSSSFLGSCQTLLSGVVKSDVGISEILQLTVNL